MREKFDQNKVNLLQRYLLQQVEKGTPRYFEIYVDSMKVVQKTNDINEFECYHEFITPDTKLLKILIYSTSATSPRNEPHYYYFGDENPVQPQVPTLSGVEIDQRLSEKISQERQRWDAEQTIKDLNATKKLLTEAEEYIAKLETSVEEGKKQLQECKDKKVLTTEKTFGNIAAIALEGFVKKNPGLAGMLEPFQEELASTETPAVDVSFSKKSEPADPQQQVYIQLLKKLETAFDQNDLNTIMQVLGALIQEPEHLPTIADLLGIPPHA